MPRVYALRGKPNVMAESTEPQTPEEEAALRALEIKHRRRHRWIALFWSVTVSVHTTLILHTLWDGWPLQERDVVLLAFFGVNALGGLGWLAWGLRGLRQEEATDRQWRLQHARWQAETCAWRQPREERGG
jgi:hypothetical protein